MDYSGDVPAPRCSSGDAEFWPVHHQVLPQLRQRHRKVVLLCHGLFKQVPEELEPFQPGLSGFYQSPLAALGQSCPRAS